MMSKLYDTEISANLTFVALAPAKRLSNEKMLNLLILLVLLIEHLEIVP